MLNGYIQMKKKESSMLAPSASLSAGGGMPLPVLLVDSREKKPLLFEHLESERKLLYTGDYSIKGLEPHFTVERKSVRDLVSTLSNRRKDFMHELERMRGYDFKRLLIIGTRQELLNELATRRINLASVDGSLRAIDTRAVPVVWCDTPLLASRLVESWAWYYYAGLHKAVSGKSYTAPAWARNWA